MYSQTEHKFQTWIIFVEWKWGKWRPKLLPKSVFFGNINNHITGPGPKFDTSGCWQRCCNLHNPTRDNALWVSSKLGQTKAKFAYILLLQIKYDCFDIFKWFLWLWKPSRDTFDILSLQGRWQIRPQLNDLLCKLARR